MKISRLMEAENNKGKEYHILGVVFLKSEVLQLYKETLKELRQIDLWKIPKTLYDDPTKMNMNIYLNISKVKQKYNIEKLQNTSDMEALANIMLTLPSWKSNFVPRIKNGNGKPAYKKFARFFSNYFCMPAGNFNPAQRDIMTTAQEFIKQSIHHPTSRAEHTKIQADEIKRQIGVIKGDISRSEMTLKRLQTELQELES